MRFVNQFFLSTGKSTSKPFISVWDTRNVILGSSASNQIAIPLRSFNGYSFFVDWGDGSPIDYITSNTNPQRVHTYAAPGIYQIKMTGDMSGFTFQGTGDRNKILDIQQWGEFKFFNVTNANTGVFRGCGNLTISATDIPDFAQNNTTQIAGLFYQCPNFSGAGIENWDVSTITTFHRVFSSCPNFQGNLSLWNVSSGTDFYETFAYSNYNQPLSSWNMSSATNLRGMFRSTPFNQPIGNWDTSNVTTLYETFYDNYVFNQNINEWNTSNVTDMTYTFVRTYAFDQPLNNWDVSKVITFFGTFYQANSFNQPLNNWSPNSATIFQAMFYAASAFDQDISSWNMSTAINLRSMFDLATNYKNANISLNPWNVGNVTDMRATFRATKYNMPLNDWDVSKVTHFGDSNLGMFQSTIFNQNLSNWNVENAVAFGFMFYDNYVFEGLGLENWNPIKSVTFLLTFGVVNAFNANSFNPDLGSWNTPSCLNYQGMFQGQNVFNRNLNSWNVSAGTNFQSMFNGCIAYNQAIDNWNMSNAINISGMFRRCFVFNQDISEWNVSKVVTFSQNNIGMFQDALAFNQNISTWDVRAGVNFHSMFWNAQSFNQNLGNWHLQNATNLNLFMFGTVGMSWENYGLTLQGWSTKVLKANVYANFDNIRFREEDTPFRQAIITNYNWTIVDQGPNIHFRFSYGYFTLYNRNAYYTGPCMRVQRASDNAVQDIFFGSDGWVNESAIAGFCGSSEGFVERLYRANDSPAAVSSGTQYPIFLYQTVRENQIKIFDGTNVITSSHHNKPVLKLDGNQFLTSGNIGISNSVHAVGLNVKTFIVGKPTSADSPNPIFRNGRYSRPSHQNTKFMSTLSTNKIGMSFNHDINNGSWVYNPARKSDFFNTLIPGEVLQNATRRLGTNFELYKNGVFQVLSPYTNTSSFGATHADVYIGYNPWPIDYYTGEIFEILHHADNYYGQDNDHFNMIMNEQKTAYGIT